MIRTYSLCATLSFLFALTTAAQQLQILVEDAAGPWSRPDGTGYANTIVREAFLASGITIQLVVVPYARCKASVISGDAAACFNMAWEPSLQGLVTFAEQPLYTSEAQVFTTDPHSTERPQSLNGIPSGSRIGLVNGYEYPPEVMVALRRFNIDYSNNESSLLKKLVLRRIQYAVLVTDPKKQVTQLIANAGISPGLIRYLFTAGRQGVYIGFSNRHPEGSMARLAFNKGMNGIRSRLPKLLQADN